LLNMDRIFIDMYVQLKKNLVCCVIQITDIMLYMAYLADCVYFFEYSVLAWKTPSGRLILSATVYLQNKMVWCEFLED
jgi:hypothetical protein